MASFGDCPLVQGQVVMMNVSTGAIEHVFNTVPNGCVGASVWGAQLLILRLGGFLRLLAMAANCGSSEPYGEAILKLHASSLVLATSWQIPSSQQGIRYRFWLNANPFHGYH